MESPHKTQKTQHVCVCVCVCWALTEQKQVLINPALNELWVQN